MNGGLCFVLAAEVAVVEDAKAEVPGEVVKVVMPERVEATVKAVEEVLVELVKVDTTVVEVVEEVLPEEVEAAVVEVVKEEVKDNRRLLLMWSRTLFSRLLLRCREVEVVVVNVVKDIVTESDVAEAVNHYVLGAGTVQKESKKSKKSYRRLGAETRVRSSVVELS